MLALVVAPDPAAADISHWFYQAKIDLGRERVYDVDPQGMPLEGKRQGRSRTSSKMFGLLDLKPVNVCLQRFQWFQGVGLYTKKDDQRLEFAIFPCPKTQIRVHFNRAIETSDYAPEAIVRYLSGILDVHGFGTGGLAGALGAALTEVAVDETSFRVGTFEASFAPDYRKDFSRYGGGLRLASTAAKDGGKRPLWSTLVLSRPMTPEEAAMGPLALLEEFRNRESRWLNASFGKKLKKKLQISAGGVNGAPHLSVQHLSFSYRRRDYLFDEASSRIHYFESLAPRGKKDREELDAALAHVFAQSRIVLEATPRSTLTSLTQIPFSGLDDVLADQEAPKAAPVSEGQTFDPSIEIVTVSVQPAEVKAGDELRLMVQYSVNGVPPGVAFEVDERRELILDGAVIATVEESAGRTAGGHTSTKIIQAPPDAKAGVYTLRARVSLAGVSAEGSALFRVR